MSCPGEPRCQHAEGWLPADSGIQIVGAKFTGLESGNEAAARTVREQLEKEQEEQKAKEASHAAEEAALRRRQEEAAQQVAIRLQKEPSCTVPELKGDTLVVARRKLAAAHCRLGTVHRPEHHHSRLRVTKESARAGERLADNAPVSLWIGAKTNAR